MERNLPLAAKWFEASAAAGVPQAQFRAGCMYESGEGVPLNYGRALALLRQAAGQGLAPAQNNLGKMYQRGEGIARDDVVARKWFTMSAEQGDATGEFDLGVMYWKGAGVPQDLPKAVHCYRQTRDTPKRSESWAGSIGMALEFRRIF